MLASRKATFLKGKFKGVTLYAHLQQFMIQTGRKLSPIMQAVSEHQIPYRQGFLTKLLANRQVFVTTITSLEAGLRTLKVWNIKPMDGKNEVNKRPKRIAQNDT